VCIPWYTLGYTRVQKTNATLSLKLVFIIYRRLSLSERIDIQVLLSKGVGIREIGRLIDRNPSTVSREIRHARTKGYQAEQGQWFA